MSAKPTHSLTVPQPALARGIAIVARAAGHRSSRPVLANILIAATKGESLRLTAMDLEMAITVDVEADVAEDLSVTLPAKTLLDLVNTLPDFPVTLALNVNTQTATLNCGRTRASVKGIRSDEFPAIPRLDPDKATAIKGQMLRSMLRRVTFAAAATGGGRPVLETVLLTLENGRLTLAASDGFRVAEDSRAIEYSGETVTALLPIKAARDLAALIDGADEVLMQADGTRAIFRAGAVEVAMQLVDGTFPQYRTILPKSYATRAVLDADTALDACKSVDIIARDAAHRMTVVIKPGGENTAGSVSMAGEAAETGDNRAEMDAAIEGEEVKICVNAKFVAEPIGAFGCEQVSVEVTTPKAPIVLKPIGDDSAWYVLMPFAVA